MINGINVRKPEPPITDLEVMRRPHVTVECVGPLGPEGCGGARALDAPPARWTPCPGCGSPHVVVTVDWPGQGATVARLNLEDPADAEWQADPPPGVAS